MKISCKIRFTLLLAAGIMLGSCKKEEPQPKKEPVVQESGQSSTDNRDVQAEEDIIFADVNTVIMEDARLRERSTGSQQSAVSTTICGMSIDTAGAHQGSLTLNFNGTTCNNRTRTGTIRVSVVDYNTGKRWKHTGCVLRVEFVNYKVARASDQKSIKLNGVQYFTNESGGTWWEFLILKTQNSLSASMTGTNLQVTFDESKTAVYNIHRKVTYTLVSNILTCTAEGIGSSGGLNNLENYGTTRDGESFTSQVTVPMEWNLTCGAHAPVSGEVNVQVSGKSFSLKGIFGTDASGNPVTVGSNQCPYGWKLLWTVNGKNNSRVIKYH